MAYRRISFPRRSALAGLLLAAAFVVLNPGAFAQPAPASASTTLDKLIERAKTKPKGSFLETPELLVEYLAAERAREPLLQAEVEAQVAASLRKKPSTQQQTGSTADTAGTTTLTEKSGFSELLNLAIENGAIVKTNSGTSYTLQTTPYLLYSKFGQQDNAATWDKYKLFRMVALSATFTQGTGASTEPKSNNFERAEVKYNWGQRSPRDQQFRSQIRLVLERTVRDALAVETERLMDFRNRLHLKEAFDAAQVEFNSWRAAQEIPITDDTVKATDKIKAELEQVLGGLRKKLDDDDRAALAQLAASLELERKALAAFSEQLAEAAKTYLEAPHWEFSFAYAYERDATISDFSDLKVIAAYKTPASLTANLNGEVTLNANPKDPAGKRLDTVRAYSIEGDLTFGKYANNTFDFTAASKWTRPKGTSRNEAFAQAKLNLYMIRGMTIPISLTYSNRTEDSNKSRVRFNVGLAMDADALMGAARNKS